MRRDGGWTIELVQPIGDINEISIRPPTLDHSIRWMTKTDGEVYLIPSTLKLLEELSGVREAQLRKLTSQDSDRVLLALSMVVTPEMRQAFQARPMSTPYEAMTPEQQYEEVADQNDPNDSRFPAINEPVEPFRPARPKVHPTAPVPDTGRIEAGPPDVMKKVG